MARTNYLSWNETFMSMANIIAQRSKDPSTQVGCCIVNENNIIVGLGYNGFPRGCNDKDFPWTKEGSKLHETKYAYVVHAEQNAILNSSQKTLGAIMYITRFPCNECTKSIIQAGIRRIYYQTNPIPEDPSTIASNRMLQSAGVELIFYNDQSIAAGHYTDFLTQSK